MVRKKEEWIGIQEARRILSENSGHDIAEAYVRILAKNGKIRTRAIDGRTNEYHLEDVKNYRVRKNKPKKQDLPTAA